MPIVHNNLYKVIWDTPTQNDLRRIEHRISKHIYQKVTSYLAQAPRELGKRLAAGLSNIYSYRCDDYRVLYRIIESEETIVITKVGHRSEVYK